MPTPPHPRVAIPRSMAVLIIATAGLPCALAENASLPEGWRNTLKVGLFLNNTVTSNADVSRDPSIVSGASATALLGTFDGKSDWRSGPDSFGNLLMMKYGRIRQRGEDLTENYDEIRYDGVYRRELGFEPSFVYTSVNTISVFTSEGEGRATQDPYKAKASIGVGQLYSDFLPVVSKVEWRLGVGGQKTWGSGLPREETRLISGPDAFVRYEHEVFAKEEKKGFLNYFAQYEAFAEFRDVGHVSHRLTAGLSMVPWPQLLSLTVDVGVRLYYETRPQDAQAGATGYNELSMLQDVLIGMTWNY